MVHFFLLPPTILWQNIMYHTPPHHPTDIIFFVYHMISYDLLPAVHELVHVFFYVNHVNIFVLCGLLCVYVHSSFEICIFDLLTNIIITILEIGSQHLHQLATLTQ